MKRIISLLMAIVLINIGATVYDANRDNKCGVKITIMTWATLAANYDAVVSAWSGVGGNPLD